jgi:hypothetical protein
VFGSWCTNMTGNQNNFPDFPKEIQSATTGTGATYLRLPDCYAVHWQNVDKAPSPEAVATLYQSEHLIEIFKGEAAESIIQANLGLVTPVYALQPGGSPAVPTGQIFMRFKEGTSAEKRRSDIEAAGYEIARLVSYAPHTAWLRPRSGKIVDALANLHALEKLAELENAQPQMLTGKANR